MDSCEAEVYFVHLWYENLAVPITAHIISSVRASIDPILAPVVDLYPCIFCNYWLLDLD